MTEAKPPDSDERPVTWASVGEQCETWGEVLESNETYDDLQHNRNEDD